MKPSWNSGCSKERYTIRGMKRIACLIMAVTMLFLQGAAVSRFCACLDAVSKPSCCETKVPCCEGGECKMHPDAASDPDLALDLFSALNFAACLPQIDVAVVTAPCDQITVAHAPICTRVRGPDCASNSLRAPPIQA